MWSQTKGIILRSFAVRLRFCAALALIGLLSPYGTAHGAEQKPEALTVSYASITGTRAPLWIAKDMGIFEKYGLDVKLVHIASGLISISAVLAGDVQLAATAGSSIVAAAVRGAPLVIIATDGPAHFQLVAHPTITRVNDLKGKTIGVSRLGTGPDYLLRRALPKLGLDPVRDVTIVPTGIIESNKRIALILQGRIDATVANGANLFRIETEGQKVSSLADFYEMGLYTTVSDISTTRRFLKDQRDTVRRFLMAFSEALWLGKQDKSAAFRVYRKYLNIGDPNLLEAMHKSYLGPMRSAKPFPMEAAIRADMDFLNGAFPDLQAKSASDFMDASVLKELEDEGFFSRLYR